MRLIDNSTKEKWNEFVVRYSGSFLQSWEWGEFQELVGQKVFRFIVEDGGEAIFLASVVKHNLPTGKSYFYIPYGPIHNLLTSPVHRLEAVDMFLKEIKKLAKSENTIFLKIEFADANIWTADVQKIKKNIKTSDVLILKSFSFQPKETLVLDLTKSEEELLSEMHQKTRYNIRLAEKKGVEIKFEENPTEKDFEIFWDIMEETAKRDVFKPHPKNYYKKMIFDSNLKTELAFAKFNLTLSDNVRLVLAANLIIYFGNTATYLHGASSNKHRELMAPHLLQWRSIQRAKKKGFKKYDFWGISEKWPGLTRFKKGFGGYEVKYAGAYDIVFDKVWYYLYKAGRLLRKAL